MLPTVYGFQTRGCEDVKLVFITLFKDAFRGNLVPRLFDEFCEESIKRAGILGDVANRAVKTIGSPKLRVRYECLSSFINYDKVGNFRQPLRSNHVNKCKNYSHTLVKTE